MSSCLTDDAIAALALPESGPLSADVIGHLAGCERCRARVTGAVAALRDPAIVAEIQRLESPHEVKPFWRPMRKVALVAAVGGLLLVPTFMRERRPPVTRELRDDDAAITMTVAPTIVAPRGAAHSPASMMWTSVPGADRYEVTIFSREGLVVWTGESPDTTMPLPREVKPATTYLWKVRARTGFDRWTESDLLEFTVPLCKGSSC